MSETNPPEVDSSPEKQEGTPAGAAWAHAVPFLAWIFVMHMLGDPAGWKYALRGVLCLGLLIYFRPWQWYPRLNLKHLPLAIGVGIGVFLVWIAGETQFASRWPELQAAYLKFGTLPPWKMPDPATVPNPYAPEVCGWPLTISRIVGSAFIIAFIEEFFWRGFLYRWMLKKNFLKVGLGEFDLSMFLLVAVFFGLEHHRWLVGIVAGLAYGWMMIRTRDIWAVGIAHAITNLLLGMYVVWAENYAFWS